MKTRLRDWTLSYEKQPEGVEGHDPESSSLYSNFTLWPEWSVHEMQDWCLVKSAALSAESRKKPGEAEGPGFMTVILK